MQSKQQHGQYTHSWIGKARFKDDSVLITNKKVKNFLGLFLLESWIGRSKWKIGYFNDDEHPMYKQTWKQLFPEIIEARCSSINLAGSPTYTVLDITFPFYSQLKKLCLSDCQLTTIEALTFMNMPLLTKLDISSNNIIEMKSLNKLKLPLLTRLKVLDNQMQRLQPIHRVKTKPLTLQLDWIDHLKFQLISIVDIRFYAKIESLNLKNEKKNTEFLKQKIKKWGQKLRVARKRVTIYSESEESSLQYRHPEQ